MSDTNGLTSDLIVALVNIGASMSRNEKEEMVVKFNGPISTKVDGDGYLHIHVGNSSVNLTDYGHKITTSEITLSPI